MDIIENANKEALEIIQNGQPTLIGLGVAGEVIPGMAKRFVSPCRSPDHMGEDVWSAERRRNGRPDV